MLEVFGGLVDGCGGLLEDMMCFAMFQTATKPFAQPAAMFVSESQLRQEHTVSGGREAKAAS